ncbi:unnamed protein product [Urochloa decumbens]|uniref:Tify domain-containing protein n=1 Tax=Urochloa decumbens TaxID=240449 RepID=A0ABC8Y9I4_9POAL
MGDEAATDAAPAAGEFVDRGRRRDGSNRRSLEEMVADVVAAAAAAHEAAEAAAEHKISNVRELLATGLLEGERVAYRQKTRTNDKVMLEGRIKGVLYSCLCHDEAMSAAQFELHAKCKSNNPNNHIFCFGKSLYTIVSHLRTKPVEEQSSVLLKLKEESEGIKVTSSLPRDCTQLSEI